MNKTTPLRQIRKYCIYCMNGMTNEIPLCPSQKCQLFDYRSGKNLSNPRKSALKAIKDYCTDCSDGPKKVRKCTFTDCSLFSFRLGKNPARKGIGNPDLKSILLRETPTE